MAKIFTITEGLENMGALKTGGQGSVYKGKRTGEIITAIKIIPTPIYSESAGDKNFIAFQNEVIKLKKVNEEPNPNVVSIMGSGITQSGNFPFIEMEYIEGPDLEELLKPPNDPVFTIKEVLKVAEHLANALAHCHKADVKHGDIKSNNVKFNIHTGNYILLDFGLSLMSDEERRTSLRRAGAIEFMAPEQNDGQLLFQTDVYSFGVILFELLCGIVPFPLKDNGETARNTVMLAHLETPPPDLLSLRQQALPTFWNNEKKLHETEVPAWLVNMIYKCLEKKPDHRFNNGVELHEHLANNRSNPASKNEWTNEQIKMLKQQNERLLREKEQLKKILHHQKAKGDNNKNLLSTGYNYANQKRSELFPNKPRRTIFSAKNILLVFLLFISLSLAYVLLQNNKQQETNAGLAETSTPLGASRDEQINAQLSNAEEYLDNGRIAEALAIYKNLANVEVPEAMYRYGNLALINNNENISCDEALEFLIKASNKDYIPAKRTLGFLHSFAADTTVLKQHGYNRCNFTRNIFGGAKLLMEATLYGDSMSGRFLEELNIKIRNKKYNQTNQ